MNIYKSKNDPNQQSPMYNIIIFPTMIKLLLYRTDDSNLADVASVVIDALHWQKRAVSPHQRTDIKALMTS